MTSDQLLELEQKTLALGTAGQFRDMLDTIHAAAVKYEIPYHDLMRMVANLALELGHVQPIQQIDSIDGVH